MHKPDPRHSHPAPPMPRNKLVAILFAGATLALVGAISPVALLVILRDGPISLGIMLAAAGAGLWLVRLLGLHGVPVRWQLLLAVALGTGTLSLLVLALGMLGMLDRILWIVLLAVFAVAGLPRWLQLRANVRVKEPPRFGAPASGSPARAEARGSSEPTSTAACLSPWLWLLVIGFAALALLAATMPPGVLWPAEGNGYDVLEYHFGAPRDYFDAGRIAYLPHNIYANFPFNVEMLYLLTMVLHGDPIDAVYTAKLLNAMMAFLAVGAVWLAGRECGRGTGLVAGLLAASCPFLVYLSGVAYVENAMVFHAAMAMAAFVRAQRDASRVISWVFACGLISGLACGCKYTAVVAVAAPLGLATVLTAARLRLVRLRPPLVFLTGCLLTFAPWLVKNTLATGNPVFPLAHNVFGSRDEIWSADGAARWHEGHLPAPEHRSFVARCGRLWDEVIYTRLFGPVVGFGLLASLAIRWAPWSPRVSHSSAGRTPAKRRRPVGGESAAAPSIESHLAAADACHLAAGCMIVVGLGAWLLATHLVGRFAIVVVVPCAVLAGLAFQTGLARSWRPALCGLLVCIAAFNLWMTWGFFSSPGADFVELKAFGLTRLMTEGKFPGSAHVPRLNELTAGGHKTLVVADARRFYLNAGADYCVVFNNSPFAAAAAERSSGDLIRWLHERDYAYVYVDWNEMRRLRTSRYGFWASLTPERFEQWVGAGLRPVETFKSRPDAASAYSTLFAVPNDQSRDRRGATDGPVHAPIASN